MPIVHSLQVDDVTDQMSKLLPAREVNNPLGSAEVHQLFSITNANKQSVVIAGCRVLDGTITRKERVQLVRNGAVLFDGKVDTLRHFKKDVQEIKSGNECGISLRGFTDPKPGDLIKCYSMTRVQRKLGEKL